MRSFPAPQTRSGVAIVSAKPGAISRAIDSLAALSQPQVGPASLNSGLAAANDCAFSQRARSEVTRLSSNVIFNGSRAAMPMTQSVERPARFIAVVASEAIQRGCPRVDTASIGALKTAAE